jgi:hypothetical protein
VIKRRQKVHLLWKKENQWIFELAAPQNENAAAVTCSDNPVHY